MLASYQDIKFSRNGELKHFHVNKQNNLFKQSCCFKKAAKLFNSLDS